MFSQLSLKLHCDVAEQNFSVSRKTTGKTKPNTTCEPEAFHGSRGGFTLIELLVVISIIALLISILLPSLAAARGTAKRASAMSAARQLGIAHRIYANANNGLSIPIDYNKVEPTFAPNGDDITPPTTTYNWHTGSRWPFPLTSFVGQEFLKGVTYIEESENYIDGRWRGVGSSAEMYYASFSPSFGLNGQFVGGTSTHMTGWEAREVIKRPEQEALAPSKLIHFTRTRGYIGSPLLINGEQVMEPGGWFKIVSPSMGTWNDEYDPTDVSGNSGFISFQYQGTTTVAGFCDGHVKTMQYDEFKDMRLWSNGARRENDPDYIPYD